MDPALELVRIHARKIDLSGGGSQLVLDTIGDAALVLLGEASHGTHEFYRLRAELTRVLIECKGFNLVAVEADWPDAYRVNRWVRAASADRTPEEALGDFQRFPRWMWRNRDVVDFLTWLRGHNDTREPAARVGFYGLDLYSLHASMAAVLQYLRKVDPPAFERARDRYSCFEHFGEDSQAYGYAATLGLSRSCEDEVVAQLLELRRRAAEYATRDGRVAADEYFFAEQNARLVRNAEEYYRAMFAGRSESWNLRDTYMVEALEALLAHTAATGAGAAKAVVWAHNSHLGDARATQMGRGGELNVGQLVRERHGSSACLIGFTTHEGEVTAASNWDEPAQLKRVRPSLPGSVERLFHEAGLEGFFLPFADSALRDAMGERLERAIGVIYRPDTERASHYFRAHPAQQFDAVLHVDSTSALEPLEPGAVHGPDAPDTYPTGV